MNRNEILEQLKENPKVSVLIVGAGINGIGTFRDLLLDGVVVWRCFAKPGSDSSAGGRGSGGGDPGAIVADVLGG